MTFLMRVSVVFLFVLSLVTYVGAVQQKTVQARIQPGGDRVAAPAFSLADASGTIRHLSDYRGKPVVVNLWATDCGGCKAELPVFVQVNQSYKNRVTIVGVSLDIMYEDLKSAAEGWARVKPFAASHGLTYPILLDDGRVEKAFKVTALPATYLIDSAGRIAATYIGIVDADNLEANVKVLISER
jgi:thiol-disulfide isomerase/thioredoxin